MTTNTTPRISGYKQLKKLRTVLAIARGSAVLSTLQQEAEATVSQDQAKRVTYLTELFSRIHREMYHDWKEQITVNHRPGSMTDACKRKAFREIIEHLVLDGEGNNQDSAIFDNNGFVIHTENIAERLSLFYLNMRSVRPFSYGNRLTLDLFMTALGNLPAFKGVYERSIDFRRLEANDPIALHDTNSGLADISLAFQHALNPNLSKNLQNQPNDYGKWPENKRFVSGIPFLSHKTADGIDCLVSVNGGLVPFDRIEEKLFIAGKQLADYPLCSAENVIGYLPDTEALRVAGKTDIDGIPVNETGAAPLFCLDVNMLSGLRSPSHTELVELLKQCAGEKAQIFDLANNEALRQKMLVIANGDERLNRAVEIAYDRLTSISKKLDQAKQSIFEGKVPDTHAKLFMSMGGAGSGKTAVEE
ncbi:MAG: toxin, partial [Methylococcaceae bacterium]|nr:toxin [Methylococcaceae bacterium]